MQVAEYRWYSQKRIKPVYRRPDYRRFPKLVCGNCPNCRRRNTTSNNFLCWTCHGMLYSSLGGWEMAVHQGTPHSFTEVNFGDYLNIEERAGPGG